MDDFYKDALKFGCLQVRPSCMPFVSAPGRRALSRAGAASASSPVANIPSRRPQTPPTSAQGFKHFSLYLRGREELLITVHHRDDPRALYRLQPDNYPGVLNPWRLAWTPRRDDALAVNDPAQLCAALETKSSESPTPTARVLRRVESPREPVELRHAFHHHPKIRQQQRIVRLRVHVLSEGVGVRRG